MQTKRDLGPRWTIYGYFPDDLRAAFLEGSKAYGLTHPDYLAYLLALAAMEESE